jgi:RNA polymerase sigma factor (sigma-70 family)
MTVARSPGVLEMTRALFAGGGTAGLSDAQLMARCAGGAGGAAEAAFAALVARHGPMVLGVCRRVLRDPNDVDDAFQAVFLVLARRAGSVRVGPGESLGRWLHGVSRKVALRARADGARRRGLGLEGVEPEGEAGPDAARVELRPVLDEELGRLPEKYRAPIALCYLEGLTHDEAAARLGWPVGTVRGRMARARDLLRDRLTRRGLAPTAGAIVAAFVAGRARAAVPESLVRSTVRAALPASAGPAGAISASATALALAQGVVATMIRRTWTIWAVGVLTLAGSAAFGWSALAGRGDDPGGASGNEVPQQESAGSRPTEPLTEALREARDAAEAMRDDDAKVQALSDVGLAYVRAGDRKAGFEALDRAAEVARVLPSASGRANAGGQVAVALATAGDPRGARDAADRAAEVARGLEGDQRLAMLMILADVYEQLGAYDAQRQALRDALKAEADDPGAVFSLRRALMQSYLDHGDLQQALAMVRELPDDQVAMRGTLLRSLSDEAAVRNESEAAAILDEAARDAARLDPVARGLAQNELALNYVTLGDYRAASETLRDLAGRHEPNTRDMAPATMARVALMMAKRGKAEEARGVLAEALGIVLPMPAATPENPGSLRDNRLRMIADVQAEIGDMEGALATADQIGSDAAERVAAFTSIGRAQAKAGDVEAARATLDRATGLIPSIAGRPFAAQEEAAADRDAARLQVGLVQVAMNDLDAARATASKIESASWRAPLLVEISGTLAKAGQYAEARQALGDIPVERFILQPLADIARAQTLADDEAGALEWIAGLRSPILRAAALRGVAEARAGIVPESTEAKD